MLGKNFTKSTTFTKIRYRFAILIVFYVNKLYYYEFTRQINKNNKLFTLNFRFFIF